MSKEILMTVSHLKAWFLERLPQDKVHRPARMVPKQLARDFYKSLLADPRYQQVKYKANRFRMVSDKYYFTFSPKGEQVHILLGRV